MLAAHYLWLSAVFCFPAHAFLENLSFGIFKSDVKSCSSKMLAPHDDICPNDSVLRRAECICDITRCKKPNCPPGTVPEVRSPALGVPDHCCETYRCMPYTLDSEKECPVDSILVDGYCVCDQRACSSVVPICNPGFTLVLDHAASGIPGSCCNNYSCAPDPKFFCPPDSRLQQLPSGKSVCVCAAKVCGEPVCKEGMEVVILNEATGVGGGCCPEYMCQKNNRRKLPSTRCPSDSEVIEGRYCICRLDICPRVSCPEGLVAYSVPASGVPGDCCDRFTCSQSIYCPPDSVSADDACTCDRSKCLTLTCETDYIPQLIEPGSNVPGYCCDTFECVRSKPLELSCPSDSQLNKDGVCVCQEALCKRPDCENGQKAKMVFPGLGVPEQCCPTYECSLVLPESIECPTDSRPHPDMSGCFCEMDLCQVPQCPPGYDLVVVDPGSTEPGKCCPTHTCLNNARCPIDSVMTVNGCVCDTTKCFEASCADGKQLVIMALGTDQPGSCCPSFDCMVIQLTCPPDSLLVDDHCVCDFNRCPNSDVCVNGEKYVVTQTAEGVVGDCCDKFDCIAPEFCPIDSIMSPNGCVCDGSKNPELPSDWVVVHQGSGVPGDCFDIFVEIKPCPSDSVLDENDSCVCEPCLNVECPPDEETLVLQEPTGSPGQCCRLIECRHPERPACPFDSQWTPLGCSCKSDYCAVPNCSDGHILSQFRTATHQPGDCCDWLVCTPIPTCPPDSQLQQNGTCKCAKNNCDTVFCDNGSSPVLVSAGEEIPGHCCDVYECRTCPNGTRLSKEGCVCDQSLCLLPKDCPDGVLVTISGESCCPVYGCMVPECPSDSFFDVPSQSCVCIPCLKPCCSGDMHTLKNASHTPGDCCEEFICAKPECPPATSCPVISCANKYLVKAATSVFPSCCDEYLCGPEPPTCPPDSILVGGDCVCLHEWCRVPKCSHNEILHVVSKAKHTPGSCCDVWICQADKPQCPYDSHYSIKNRCICNSCPEPECEFGYVPEVRHKAKKAPGDCCDVVVCQMIFPDCPPGTSLSHDGKCICTQNCLPINCDGEVVVVKPGTGVYPFCCDQLICMKNLECPDDSIYDHILMDCVCNKCPSVICPGAASPQLVTTSSHRPGSCCDTYMCGTVAPVLCPPDSAMNGTGCVCNLSSCVAPSCDWNEITVLLSAGNTAEPGSCCDTYVCTSIVCPPDSILANGTCACIEDCMPPACVDDEVPYIIRDGTGNPGQCCPTYQCSLPSPPVCPPGNILSPDQKSCTCDSCPAVTCGVGFVPKLVSKASLQPPDCCDVIECVVDIESLDDWKAEQCPQDSHMVDGRCICHECSEPSCPKTIIILPFAGTPGDCCPVSACVDEIIECPIDSYNLNGRCVCLPCPTFPPICVSKKKSDSPGSCCDFQACPGSRRPCPPGSIVSPDSKSCACSPTPKECAAPKCTKSLILLEKASNIFPDCCDSYACLDCPLDSILSPEGKCVCNTECPTPACPPGSDPTTIVPRQNTSGHCCDQFACIEKAPFRPSCDPYSMQHPNMTCECFAPLCPDQPKCPPEFRAVAIPQFNESCCPVYTCSKETTSCPQDSYISGGVCKCLTCPDRPYCPDGSLSTVNYLGNSTPGSCCNVYECFESLEVVCDYGAVSLRGRCICDIELCRAPLCGPNEILTVVSQSSEIYPDCCDSFMCHILECPPDSVLVNGECACVQSCPKVQCPQGTFVQIIRQPSLTPGECCFVWTCVQERSLPLVTCPPDSYVTFDGQCVCNSLCDNPWCPNGMMASITEQPVNKPGKCCGKFSCIPVQPDCPQDSYVVDNGCKCSPCVDIDCPIEMEAVMVESGNQTVGSCCDVYTCTLLPLNCSVGSVPSLDGCVCTGSCPSPDCGELQISISQKSSMIYPDCCDKLACLNLTCPDDSFLIPGVLECQCNPVCPESNCPRNFQKSLVAKGSGSPGVCCDQWKCVQLPGELCPPDSLPKENGCICDKTRCMPAPECIHGYALISPATEIPGKCCPQYKCIDISCPPDSYYMNGNCLCRKCDEIVCPDKTNIVVIAHGNLEPGSCCTEYICEPRFRINCTYGSTPSPDGTVCVCHTAACRKPECDLDAQLVTVRNAANQYPDCCNEYACIASCPQDSIATYDGYCVCNFDMCLVQSCPSDSTLIVAKATKQPGDCCDKISCYSILPSEDSLSLPEPTKPPNTIPGLEIVGFCQCTAVLSDSALTCPDGMVSVVYRKPTYIADDCCPLYSCIQVTKCPTDSFPVFDSCMCMRCVTPFCPDGSPPKLLTSGNNKPGSCCDTFECHDTQCPVGSMLVPDGRCACIKSLCPQPNCAPGKTPSVVRPSTSTPEDCCSSYACLDHCPEDSVYFDTECICKDACETECPPHMKKTIVLSGNGIPGSCCDVIRCELALPGRVEGLPSCNSSACTTRLKCPMGLEKASYHEPSGIPPDCCPKYTCVPKSVCPEDSYWQDGRCLCYPCPYSHNVPHKSPGQPGSCCAQGKDNIAPEGTQVCDPRNCPVPICDKVVLRDTDDGCCKVYACATLECPWDSIVGPGGCVCLDCSPPVCPYGSSPVVLKPSLKIPGYCCSEFVCVQTEVAVCGQNMIMGPNGDRICDEQCHSVQCPDGLTASFIENGPCCPQIVCIEPVVCPSDSYWNGECLCMPCPVPDCPNPKLRTVADHKPGSCCDLYDCPESIECEYGARNENGECVCDGSLCFTPVCGDTLVTTKKASNVYPDCCSIKVCVEILCPPDSYMTAHQSCSCLPNACQPVVCPPGTNLVTISSNISPGNCCPETKCEKPLPLCPSYMIASSQGGCVCAPELCPPPPNCDDGFLHTAVSKLGCCPSHQCIKHKLCPVDSYYEDGVCKCHPCPPPCRAEGMPGSCCMDCIEITRPDVIPNKQNNLAKPNNVCPEPACGAGMVLSVIQESNMTQCPLFACIEQCPPNSCECADCPPEICPPGTELVMVQLAKNKPGSCCNVFTCEVNFSVCPMNTLPSENGCECDPDSCSPAYQCPLGTKLVITRSPTFILNDCCPEYSCISIIIDCPADSYRSENLCICYPCKVCPDGRRSAEILSPGLGVPGSCCPVYDCGTEVQEICEAKCDRPVCRHGQQIGVVKEASGKYPDCCDEYACFAPQCPPGSAMAPNGQCVCMMQCQNPTCPPGMVSKVVTKATMEPGYCCDMTVCIAPTEIHCPRNTIEIDNRCVCDLKSCRIPTCPANYSAIVSRYATGLVGDCCNQYTCAPNPSCPPDMVDIKGSCECLPCTDPFCPYGLEPTVIPQDGGCCPKLECNQVVCPPGTLLSPDLTTCVCDTRICPVPSCPDSQVLKILPNSKACCPLYLCAEISCHVDSILVNGKCACAPEFCEKPDCPRERLEILQLATHQPGSCCDIFVCQDSALEATEESPECPPFTRPTPSGTCECDCDLCQFPPMCPPGYSPAVVKHPSMIIGSCCVEYACMPVLPDCPRDSFIQNRICQCFPCHESPEKCPDGSSLILLKNGDARPGSCCNVYTCKKHPTCSLGAIVSVKQSMQCECQKSLCPLPSCDPKFVVRIVHTASGTYPDCCDTYKCFKSDCPLDSIMVDGQCVCAVSNIVHPCLPGMVPVVTRRGMGTPGNCNMKVVCELPASLNDPCPEFSVKLPDGSCICMKNLCPDPVCPTGFSPVVHSEAKAILGSCCSEYTCILLTTCPPDSYAVGDTCKCLPCPKPLCNDGSPPVIDAPGRKIPNQCCDSYHCAAPLSTTCQLGSTLSPDGTTCLCDASHPLSYCEPGFTFVITRYATNIYPDCHNKVACIKMECPPDSIMVNKKCQCQTCVVPKCAPGSYAELISPGLDTPGHCCGIYECQLSASVVQCPPYMIQLSDYSCHCAPESCPVISCPSGLSPAVLASPSCCPEFICQVIIVCPEDSYVDKDSCKCLPCPVRICQDGSSLIAIRSGNSEPGSCCEEFICAGQLTCDSGFVMDKTGRCICDKHQCFIPTCSGDSTAVISRYAKGDDCCDTIACIKFTCPTDSFLAESKCKCLPCQKPHCPPGTEIFKFKHSKGVPGECCGQWICKETIRSPLSTTCQEFEILVNDKCECSLDLCFVPICPPSTKIITRESGSCCPEYTCSFALDCPPDSYLLNNECMCYQCLKPECPGTLKVQSRGNNKPGSCCTVYDCQEEVWCPTGSIFSEITKACICELSSCDQPVCSFGKIAVLGSPSGLYPDCCPQYACMEDECPPDSLMGALGCFCIPNYCPTEVCPPNSRAILVKRASRLPGDCCDSYECEVFVVPTGCPAETHMTPDGCLCDECTKPECPGNIPIILSNGTCCPQYACFHSVCPNDSYTFHNECHCLPCKEQSCPTGTPTMISSGNNTPGSCCPVYECRKGISCPSGTRYNGSTCICDISQCSSPQCPPGTQMLAINQKNDHTNCCPEYACLCPPGQELVNGVCVCSTCKAQFCPPGSQKIITRFATGLNGGCCDEVMCQRYGAIICPFDSYQTPAGCVCFGSCAETACPANMMRVVVEEGSNVPGKCCPKYSCVTPVSCAVDSYWNVSECVCLPCPVQLCEGQEEIISKGSGMPGTCCDVKYCNRAKKESNCPHNSKMGPDGTCACDMESCSAPLCDEGYSLALVEEAPTYPGCCPEYACIGACPPDSWQSVDTCECTECSYLSCPAGTHPVVQSQGTGAPGNCCDTIVCKSGHVHCPPYSLLINGYCQCSVRLCESPPKCPNGHKRVIVHTPNNFIGDCCPKYACYPDFQQCPSDSYKVNSECICYECTTVETMLCPNGTAPKMSRKGSKRPGSCCDEYVCEYFCPRGSIYQNVTNRCICDTNLCPLPSCNASTTMAVIHDAAGIYPDCCPEYGCLTLDCPADSIVKNKRCVCARVCHTPQCSPGMESIVVQKGNNKPGQCCDKVSCQLTKPVSQNACPPNSIRLTDGSCGCIPDLCPNSPKCPPGTWPTILHQSQTECCPEVVCSMIHECPPDSYLIGGHCECLPCPRFECPLDTTMVIHQPGTNLPGVCCDDYECISGQYGQAMACHRGAVLDITGKFCVCDERSCEVPSCPAGMETIIVEYSYKVYPDCCNVFGCTVVQCPPDSVLIDGVCKCMLNCDIPRCPGGAVLVKESPGQHVPGRCCDIWTCNLIKAHSITCPPNMKLVGNECTCDKTTCLVPRCPPRTERLALETPTSCCTEYICQKLAVSCPTDSYLVDDLCVCLPCVEPDCQYGQKMKTPGNHAPGSCCNVYECIDEITCPYGSSLSPKGSCVCDSANCFQPTCPMGESLVRSERPLKYPKCCQTYACMKIRCPVDSVAGPDGKCVCMECQVKMCPAGFKLVFSKDSGNPGSCCPHCEAHSVECPPGATVSEGQCICDHTMCPPKPTCPPRTTLISYKEASGLLGECCTEWTCYQEIVSCPPDSYLQNGTCVCQPCMPPPTCDNKIVTESKGKPGSCCSVYECIHAETTCNGCQDITCGNHLELRSLSTPTGIYPDCCPRQACIPIKCPRDSFMASHGRCVCIPDYCASETCPPMTTRVIKERARGEPGACCDEILCLEVDTTPHPRGVCDHKCLPHMKWSPDQKCVCAQELCPPIPTCPLGTMPIIYRHPNKIAGDCCPQYACITSLPECPLDSYFTNGTCACYPCPPPPPCPRIQTVSKSGEGRPGSCCSVYQCEEAHPVCTCPYGQIARPDCTCVCSKTRCHKPVCEQGSVPRVTSIASMVVPDCCDVIACVKFNCPPDSILKNGQCVCMENYCNDISCPEGSEKIIVTAAKDVPGECCDVFACDEIVKLCPPGTSLTTYGMCECLKEVCPLPPDCPPGTSPYHLEETECCPQYGCRYKSAICPPDSYDNNGQCSCMPCVPHECRGSLVTLQCGNGMPGTCCAVTICKEEQTVCPLGNQISKNGRCECKTMQCSKPSCDAGLMLIVTRKASKLAPDCCDTFACHKTNCPVDSIADLSGKCTCLLNSCQAPPCWPGSRLVKIQQGFGIPGRCCDKWMCEQMQSESTTPCLPFHVYQNGACICEESSCPSEPICPKGFAPLAHQGWSCCPEYFCFPLLDDCPDDSYYEVEGGCRCYPCNKSLCPEGFETILSIPGNNSPGSCCDVYTCQIIMSSSTCGPCGVMQPDGQCVCGEACCAASPPCPDGVLVINKVSTGWYPDCCDKYACIRNLCPTYSIPDGNGNCICQTCPEPSCPSGIVQIDVAPTGMPDNCCGTWSCKMGLDRSCPEPPSCSAGYQLSVIDMVNGCKIYECERIECPSDSVNVNGVCYCDVSRCPVEYCGVTEIMISVRKSSNVPGDCCDQVMCLANSCPPYHVYDTKLASCVCSPDLCPPTPHCGSRNLQVVISFEVTITTYEGCCSNYACGQSLACPLDSRPNAQNTGCMCDYRSCVVPECRTGETLLEVLPSSSNPGFCCPSYLCMEIIDCPWDSKMVFGPNSELYCECDPLRCPPQSCPQHSIVYVTSRSLGTPGSCCSNSECESVSCPPYTTQDNFGNCICDCKLCPPPSCSIGFSIVIISECGTPPFCCPQFECIKQEVQCQYGETWVENQCVCIPETCSLPDYCTILLPPLPGQCCHRCISFDSVPQCPSDSYVDSLALSCACLPCQELWSCSTSLVVIQEGTGTPGSCCPQYSCPSHELCPPGSVLNATNCICNADSCLHPTVAVGFKTIVSRVATREFPDCCNEILVIPDLECPSDAIMYHDGTCICPECPDPSCPVGSTPYIIRGAAGVPGKCCEVYQCKVITKVCHEYAVEKDGVCECRVDLCYRPSCSPGFMQIETITSSNVYPDCCSTYECTIIPKCPPDCRLSRPMATCVCDPTLCADIQCPSNQKRVIVREATGMPGECCNSYLCMSTVVCPADSKIEGTSCVCDQRRCKKPTCDANFTLVEIATGKDTPGACCNHYECNLIKCPYGTQYNQQSESCVCDRERCVLPICQDGSVLVKLKDAQLTDSDCCDSYVCQWVLVKCPPDSKRDPRTGQCVCEYSSCPVVKCSDSFHPVVTREPFDTPGQCCPIFECRQTVECPTDSKPNIAGVCVCNKNCSASTFQCKEGMTPILKEPKTGLPGQCCDVYSCTNKCPVDSIVNDSGECVCDMTSCSEPICPEGMKSFVVSLTSSVPGKCCKEHKCHFHCPADSRFNESLASCSCYLRSCPEVKCPDSHELQIISLPTRKPGRCCVEFECVAPCPGDSVWDPKTKSCQCSPCKKLLCPQGQHATVSYAGHNIPGQCCPKYNCTTSITVQCSEFSVVNENNRCACVPSLCPRKSCDDVGSRLIVRDSFIDANNCCLRVDCEPIKCPPDSTMTDDGECVCDYSKCEIPACSATVFSADRSLPFPGSCCPKYSCSSTSVVPED